MKLSKNDREFLRSIQMPAPPTVGRPKGAKDTQRRKNNLYHWNWGDLRSKFYARVFPTAVGPHDEPCWKWIGATTRGRGTIVYGSRQDNGGKQPHIQAHRLSWELHQGPIPEDVYVGQRCENKLCVNPTHLYLRRS